MRNLTGGALSVTCCHETWRRAVPLTIWDQEIVAATTPMQVTAPAAGRMGPRRHALPPLMTRSRFPAHAGTSGGMGSNRLSG